MSLSALLILGGCVKNKCPGEDMIIISPWTNYPVVISEGFFDDPDNCYSKRKWDAEVERLRERMDQEIKEYLEQRPKDDI